MALNGNFKGLFESLKKDPLSRTLQDVLDISSVIHEYFESLDLETTKYLSSFAHYMSFEKDDILFNVQDRADCWFILLTGKVLLKGNIYHAPCSFGKIYNGQTRRTYECRSIDYCQLMKIYYPTAIQIDSLEKMSAEQNRRILNGEEPQNSKNVNESSDDEEDVDEDTFQESFLEFDFSDLANDSFTSITVKDVVQECLEKNACERTNQDVKILREFMLHFNNQVFNSFQKEVQDLICRKLSYVVVEKEQAVVISEGEELKYWAFVINGCLEITHPMSYNRLIHMGDSFGIDPHNEDQSKSPFTIVTRVPSCHFISLSKEDWASIRNKEVRSVEKETIEDGKKVLVVEEREVKKGGRKGYFVKKGTSEQLVKFLVDERTSEDPSYVEDFLLTSRIFLQECMNSLTEHLMLWFGSGGRMRDKSVRIVLLWVNNHFEDFEADLKLSHFLMEFMQSMQTSGMSGQLELLHRACCAQAKSRRVVMDRPSMSQPWGFNVVLGKDQGKVFVNNSTLVYSSEADNDMPLLLCKGDQILEVNGETASSMSNKNFVELINTATRLELQVKSNFVEHSEALATNQRSRTIFPKQSCSQEESEKSKKKSEWTTRRIFSNVIEPFFRKMTIFGQSPLSPSSASLNPGNSRHLVTGSNPDLTSIHSAKHGSGMPNLHPSSDPHLSPQEVLTVYLLDQSKPLTFAVSKNQNVRQVVKMTLKLSGLCGDGSSHSLFEVVFRDDRVMRYSRLPDCTADLHSKIKDDTRLYLVSNNLLDTNWVNDLNLNGSQDGGHQGHVLLWHMKPHDVATELCLRDFQLFRNIQSSEYVERIFNKDEGRKTSNLEKFSKLVNEEMFWVVSEICSEASLENRVKLIEFFLKIAQHCLEQNNFNSTFAILSGLRHNSVSKLKRTWKRVPTKYAKLFENLQDLLDPSNNMSKYRSLLNVKLVQNPAIPFFPIVMKDLTFIDLGNKTFIDGMINYEKMRMIAKQIRSVTNMASPFYHNKSLELPASLNSEATSPPSMNITAFATIRKKKTPHIASAPLKLEENSSLAKRYFENLRIIQNEEELAKMSLALESQRHNSSRSKSEISPQNLTKTNHDCKLLTPFKFGTDSQQSIQKLIGLTDKIAPYSQLGNKRRPTALSLSSYDTLVLPLRKGSESSGKRRDAIILSPTCSAKIKHLPAVKLTSESSSVSAPLRYNPTMSIGKALFAITNQKPFNMAIKPQDEKSSVSSSAEELEELFSQTCMTSQSTPVSPFRSIPISNLSLNSSTPKNPSQTSFGNGSTKPDNSVDSTSLCDSASTETSRSRGNDSGRGVSLERVDSAGEGKGQAPDRVMKCQQETKGSL